MVNNNQLYFKSGPNHSCFHSLPLPLLFTSDLFLLRPPLTSSSFVSFVFGRQRAPVALFWQSIKYSASRVQIVGGKLRFHTFAHGFWKVQFKISLLDLRLDNFGIAPTWLFPKVIQFDNAHLKVNTFSLTHFSGWCHVNFSLWHSEDTNKIRTESLSKDDGHSSTNSINDSSLTHAVSNIKDELQMNRRVSFLCSILTSSKVISVANNHTACTEVVTDACKQIKETTFRFIGYIQKTLKDAIYYLNVYQGEDRLKITQRFFFPLS